MILISPSSIISALTSVLIDKLVKLKTSFLYFANLSLVKCLLIPRMQKVVWLLDFELMLDKRVHPQNVVVLALKLKLITD